MAFRGLGFFGKTVALGTGVAVAGSYVMFRVVPYSLDMYKVMAYENDNTSLSRDTIERAWHKMNEQENNNSLLKKHLTEPLMKKLKGRKTIRGGTLMDIIKSGVDNPDSAAGVYVPERAAYDTFSLLLDPIVWDLHKAKTKRQPDRDFGLSRLNHFDAKLSDVYVKRTKIECVRTVDGFTFHPLLRQDDYLVLESKFKNAFHRLGEIDEFKGKYYSLKTLKVAEAEALEKDGVVFKDNDKFLKSANGYRFWPTGRAIFYSNVNGKQLSAYVNGEEHLKLVSVVDGGDVKSAMERLGKAVQTLEKYVEFARLKNIGNAAFSVFNVGSGVRANVEITLPKLGANKEKLQETCEQLNLTLRDVGKGVYRVGNRQTYGVTEFEAVKQMYDGVTKLIEIETTNEKK